MIFLGRTGIDEATDLFPRALEQVRGALAQGVHATMHVGVVLFVNPADGVDDRPGLVGRRRIVEIDQWLAVNGLGQDGEFRANFLHLEP